MEEENKGCGCKCDAKKCSGKNILLWVFIIAIVVGGLFYFTVNDSEEIGLGLDDVKQQEVPDGVEVVDLEGGNRLVKNVEDGYQVEIGDDKFLYSGDVNNKDLVIQDFAEPNIGYGGLPGCRVLFETKIGNLGSFDDTIKKMCDDLKPDCESYSIEEENINNIKWTVGKVHGSFLGTDNPEYHTSVDDKVYSAYFLCVDKDFINSTLNNFSF